MVGAGIHIIEYGTHVQLLMRVHVNYCQINGLRAGVAGAAGNVALVEYFGLVNIRVMHALAADVIKILAPAAEIVHGALRAVCVKELHYVALLAQSIRRLYAAVRKLAAHYHQRLFVARGGAAHKVVRARVFCVYYAVLYQLVNVYKAFRQPCLGYSGCARVHVFRLFFSE